MLFVARDRNFKEECISIRFILLLEQTVAIIRLQIRGYISLCDLAGCPAFSAVYADHSL